MKKVVLILALFGFVGAVQAKPVEKKATEQAQAVATSYDHSLL